MAAKATRTTLPFAGGVDRFWRAQANEPAGSFLSRTNELNLPMMSTRFSRLRGYGMAPGCPAQPSTILRQRSSSRTDRRRATPPKTHASVCLPEESLIHLQCVALRKKGRAFAFSSVTDDRHDDNLALDPAVREKKSKAIGVINPWHHRRRMERSVLAKNGRRSRSLLVIRMTLMPAPKKSLVVAGRFGGLWT